MLDEATLLSECKTRRQRRSGPGGQHRNKVETAVRLIHVPTGVIVNCQAERSQGKNRSKAMSMLRAKLYQIEIDKREAEVSARHGEKTKIGFGGQTVRNYVLHPDQFVKDARTGTKVGNPQPLLDGDLDLFLESYLRWTLAGLSTAEERV